MNKCKSSKVNDSFKYNNITTTDKKVIASKFNEYFVNIGSTLASTIPQEGPNFETYLPPACEDSIFLTPASSIEVKKIVSNLNNNAPGHDEITLNDIKPVLNCLIEPLTHVTNLSLS